MGGQVNVNYERPDFSPQPKPGKKVAVVKADKRKAQKRTRAQCVAIVWTRAKGKCERCGRPVQKKGRALSRRSGTW
jgi:formamidopyrimidine-DNA glycosylase